LEEKIKTYNNLELLAPVSLNIVYFRYNNRTSSEEELEYINREILLQLQEKGIATISPTILNGKYTLRVCNVNHRTQYTDLDLFLEEVQKLIVALTTV
jgi:aromatic-L-amino-acid decarboxylase